MKFKYSFQKILDLKGNEKSQAEWILSEAMTILNTHSNELSQLEKEKEVALENLKASMAGQTTIQALLSMQDYIDTVDQRITRKVVQLEESRQIVLDKKKRLQECMQQEDIWNKSKEKAFEKFDILMKKKEQEELDDMVSARYQRMSS